MPLISVTLLVDSIRLDISNVEPVKPADRSVFQTMYFPLKANKRQGIMVLFVSSRIIPLW